MRRHLRLEMQAAEVVLNNLLPKQHCKYPFYSAGKDFMLNIPTRELAHHTSSFQNPRPTITLICQHALLHDQAKDSLQTNGFTVTDNGSITVIVDSSQSNALLTLEFHQFPNPIVMTSNPCSEYQADLLEFGAKAVVSPIGNNNALFHAIHCIAKLEPFQSTLPTSAQLTPAERRILRLIASGLENKEIARTVGSSDSTVRNQVTVVLNKISSANPELRLENRTQLALFYWGMWQSLLEGMTRFL
jgi:DNA-binding CsgD family transcriptional regulator